MKYLLNLIGNKKTSTIAYSDFIKYCINNQLKSHLIDCENNSVKDIIYSHRNTHLLLNFYDKPLFEKLYNFNRKIHIGSIGMIKPLNIYVKDKTVQEHEYLDMMEFINFSYDVDNEKDYKEYIISKILNKN